MQDSVSNFNIIFHRAQLKLLKNTGINPQLIIHLSVTTCLNLITMLHVQKLNLQKLNLRIQVPGLSR